MKFDGLLMTDVTTILNIGKIPMLLGEPGIGKSSWVENLASLLHTECFTLACNQLYDKADLTGARLVPLTDKDNKPVFDTITGKQEYEQVFYPHSVVNQAINYANEHKDETPILFLDELNRTPADVTSALLSLATTRSIGNKKLPNNLRIITAGNDKGNVTALDTASISRFVLRKVEPDIDTYLSLDDKLNEFIKNVLNQHPEYLFGKSSNAHVGMDDDDDDDNSPYGSYEETYIDDILNDEEQMVQLTTPRTISALSDYLNSYTNDQLKNLLTTTVDNDDLNLSTNSLLEEIIVGFVGNTDFKDALLKEINTNVNKVSQQKDVNIIPPTNYQSMKSLSTRDDVTEFIDNLSTKMKSAYLVYTLYEKEDNRAYIETIANKLQDLQKDDVNKLMTLASGDELYPINVRALLDTNSTIAQQLDIILRVNLD